MKWTVIEGDLLEQQVDVIVNPWNRNIIPWWLLIPQGVSGAIKRRAGYGPFRELGRMGAIPLGAAVVTGAGKLHYRAIIHVASINMWWRSSAHSIQNSVHAAMKLAEQGGHASVAMPLIGAGTGGFGEEGTLALMEQALSAIESPVKVTIVRFKSR